MIEYPEHIITALGIVPIVKRLYEQDIIDIGGAGKKAVQMTKAAFHDVFKTWFTESRPDEYVEHHHILFDVDFFCLVRKEDNDGLGRT